MNDQLEVKLLGCPLILLGGAPLSLPYRQAEAIFYYVFYNKTVNKYTLADLIWGDKCNEEKISSNLRNAFYIIRKSLGKDFISKKSGDIITLGADFNIPADVEQFLKSPDNLSLYKGDFLEGFYLKNNTLFNDWVTQTRQLLKNFYLEKLQLSIRQLFEKGDLSACEALCLKQIKINEFDETAYKYLMQIYLERKNYTLALNAYNRLEQLFEQELFEKPGEDVQALAASIQNTLNKEISLILESKKELKTQSCNEAVFYGRKDELEQLRRTLQLFKKEISLQNILITGEPGIGKTRLANHLLSEDPGDMDLLILKTCCYFAEEKYILKSWQNLVRQLYQYLKASGQTEEYKTLVRSIFRLFPFLKEDSVSVSDTDEISTPDYKSIQSIFVNALIPFSQKHKIIFYVDDVQWADETSLSLIRDIITSTHSYGAKHILFLMTARLSCYDEVRSLFEDMSALHLLEILTLKPFDFNDTGNMALQLLPGYTFTDGIQKQLFYETEGNPFFITEAVHNIRYNGSPGDITPNMRGIIKQRIAPVPNEHRQILNLISVFFDGVSFSCLSELTRKEDYELVELLEYLLQQNLLRENLEEEDTYFFITHQKIQEYVYEEMSWTKKRILHHKAGLYYENRLHGNIQDMALYPKLIYHFDKGANRQKYLKYAVKYLYNYLNVTHEFFPIIENNFTVLSLNTAEEAGSGISKNLGSIEKLLHTVEETLTDHEGELLKAAADDGEPREILSDYLHMTGRHYIRSCNYEKGLSYILRLKELNRALPTSMQFDKLLKANRQLICIYINRYEPDKMKQIIEESLTLLTHSDIPDRLEETAIWQRLNGLYDIMSGQPENGVRHLNTAITIFTQSPKKEHHLYNLAAAYSWLGEIERYYEHYEKSLEYYRLAVGICTQNFLVSGAAIFYAYEGMALYDSRSYDSAEEKLLLAIRHYNKVNLMWGRSLPYSYYAQILLQKKCYQEAREHLATALTYAKQLENPYEMGIIFRIYVQIKAQMPENPALLQAFNQELKKPLSYYLQKAEALLKGVYSPIDKKILSMYPMNT